MLFSLALKSCNQNRTRNYYTEAHNIWFIAPSHNYDLQKWNKKKKPILNSHLLLWVKENIEFAMKFQCAISTLFSVSLYPIRRHSFPTLKCIDNQIFVCTAN